MTHNLPSLSYPLNALGPSLSNVALSFHYGKHLQTYLNNVNDLVRGTSYAELLLDRIIAKAPPGPLMNNAAQAFNHTFYFTQFQPINAAKKAPDGALLKAIKNDFTSFENFVSVFTEAAVSLFGSGWIWLVYGAGGRLTISSMQNAGCPLVKRQKPLLTCDVWEHAYYLDYQNRRAAYVSAFWDILDWKVIEERFTSLKTT